MCVCVQYRTAVHVWQKKQSTAVQAEHILWFYRQEALYVHKCVFVLSLPSSLLSSPTYFADTVQYPTTAQYSTLLCASSPRLHTLSLNLNPPCSALQCIPTHYPVDVINCVLIGSLYS